ncbi:GTPase ObgE [Spirochaetia bacterium 38H-sp]|uniref:GTPase Obg n=1 Tax=Rarispira pelagica TaxID=3141764 RepID=A0ABU9UE04_9SPIR
MEKFVDEVVIELSSGKGGDGSVSFRREKYIPKGGPDGGDGGDGGSVVFVIKENLKTLLHLSHKPFLRAKNGEPGKGKKMHGKKGEDLIIEVPPGTVIRDADTGELIKDLSDISEPWTFLKGGKGGKGNVHYKSSVRQVPRYAQPGKPGITKRVVIELRLIADIGLVGFPNAGKSTLLSVLTNAHPRIAPYPFTTKIPNLGVLYVNDFELILADIPGIIEGASHGAGLGHKFLKHISRTSCIAYMIDLSDDNYRDALDILKSELVSYGYGLEDKPYIIIGTKLDMPDTADRLEELKKMNPDDTVIGISSVKREGLDTLIKNFYAMYMSARTPEDG